MKPAATSEGMSSGIGLHKAAGNMPFSAIPPCPPNTATRVPMAGSVTPGPEAMTVPQTSIPRVNGTVGVS